MKRIFFTLVLSLFLTSSSGCVRTQLMFGGNGSAAWSGVKGQDPAGQRQSLDPDVGGGGGGHFAFVFALSKRAWLGMRLGVDAFVHSGELGASDDLGLGGVHVLAPQLRFAWRSFALDFWAGLSGTFIFGSVVGGENHSFLGANAGVAALYRIKFGRYRSYFEIGPSLGAIWMISPGDENPNTTPLTPLEGYNIHFGLVMQFTFEIAPGKPGSGGGSRRKPPPRKPPRKPPPPERPRH